MKKEPAECIGGEYIKKTKRDKFREKNKIIKDDKLLDKIDKVKLPKTYDNIHICKYPNKGNILGYGYDKTNKKQIIYNENHIKNREQDKCNHLKEFAKIYDKLDEWVMTTLKKSENFEWETIMAITLFLLIHCNFRVGNDVYVENYDSYGTTTLECRHINPNEKGIEIVFNGKKGVENRHICSNKIFIPIMQKLYEKRCKKKSEKTNILIDDTGRQISSKQVNLFLKKFHPEISAKDIRTWNANNIFIKYWLEAQNLLKNKMSEKDILKEVIERTAEDLYHTPQVCKKEYISPKILNLIENKPEYVLGNVRKFKKENQILKFLLSNILC